MGLTESEDTDIIPAPSSIVRAPSEITTVNSGLAKTVIPSKDSLAKVTYYKLDLDTILDGLIPDPLPESIGKDNAIHCLKIWTNCSRDSVSLRRRCCCLLMI